MKTSKALHFCALQPNAKQWNHQSRLRSPVKLHQLEQLVATKVSPFGMHVYTIFVLLLSNWLEVLVFLFGQWIFVWCLLSELPSSIMARASNKTLVAKPSRTKCKGVRPWRSPHCATVKSFKCRLCIYGVYLLSIYHICICCGCVNIYIYTYILHIYIYKH